MPKCVECGSPYEIPAAGDIMLSICFDCRKKPKAPAYYALKNGLWVTNPEYEEWQKETQKLTK